MSPIEQGQVQSLLGEIMGLPPEERSDFLDRHCGTDGVVRDALDELLAEHEQRSGLLDRPLFSPPPAGDDDVWTGRVLKSRYRIERFLARGGMSAVYLARDEQLAGRLVVVKFLHSWAPRQPWVESRFRQEMEALARIDDHAVVGILDTGETADGLPFLVMQYIDGVTLRAEMGRGAMSSERVAGLIRQIARAVAAAHAKGVLHRDLKPENIMLEGPGTSEECVRLIDFGIARLEETDSSFATATTQLAGTTTYMAPEQLRGKSSAASDLYAMAVIAYEMLAGQRPFAGASPIEIYEQQRAGASLKPLLQRAVPEYAAHLIVKQLAFRAEDRSPAALDAGEAIAAALLHPDRHTPSRRRAVIGLAGGGLAIAGGGIARWARPKALSSAERLVVLPLPCEPLEHGFRQTGTVENRVIPNSDRTGFEAVRLVSNDQGGYYYPLDREQKAAALRLGWRMTFDAAPEEGETYTQVDFENSPVRYSVNLVARPGKPDIACLITAITPLIRWIEFPLAGPAGARHRYVLALGPGAAGAEFWVDGTKIYSDYRGLSEYLYRRGPEIGVGEYRSARGVGVFWTFRFEIG